MEKTVVKKPYLQPMEGHDGAENDTAAHIDPLQEQAPDRNCSPWKGANAGAGFLAGPVGYEGSMLGPDGLNSVRRNHS